MPVNFFRLIEWSAISMAINTINFNLISLFPQCWKQSVNCIDEGL